MDELREKLATVGLLCELQVSPINSKGEVILPAVAVDNTAGFRYVIIVESKYTISFDIPNSAYDNIDESLPFKLMVKSICNWFDAYGMQDVVFDIIPYEDIELVANPMFLLKSVRG